MQDRNVLRPDYYMMEKVQGTENIIKLTPAPGEVYEEGTLINKATLWKDATAALFGLGVDSVPDDGFAYLGKYAQHWWKRTPIIQIEKLTDISSQEQVDLDSSQVVSYSSSVVISDSGDVSLDAPESITIQNTLSGANTLAGLAPCYITNARSNPSTIFYLPPETSVGDSDTSKTIYYASQGVRLSETSSVKAKTVSAQTGFGDPEYVQSSDRSAYPDSGEQDGYEYEYLGIPFENAVGVPKIETGSYTGTGTYGTDNPNSLTLGFAPKWVLVYQRVNQSNNVPNNLLNTNGKPYIQCEYLGTQFGVSSAYYQGIKISGGSVSGDDQAIKSEDGKTISWRSTSADFQANALGYRYDYIAFG